MSSSGNVRMVKASQPLLKAGLLWLPAPLPYWHLCAKSACRYPVHSRNPSGLVALEPLLTLSHILDTKAALDPEACWWHTPAWARFRDMASVAGSMDSRRRSLDG